MSERASTGQMRKLEAVDLKPWMLPLIVLALVGPITAAALLLGPAGAFAAGFLTTAALAIIAIRTRYDEEIGVAATPDAMHRALVVCLAPIERSPDATRVAEELAREAEPFEGSGRSLVLAPARNTALAEWLSDVDQARAEAEQRLMTSLGNLRRAGVEADGKVGEDDIVQTVEDTLHTFAACDVIVVTGDSDAAADLQELRRRLDRPIHELHTEPEPTRRDL